MGLRIGFSKDIHRLVENRKLIIGGVVVPYHLGELAHSDGDVLYHALAESILGALALGDLGKHFPDTSKDTLNMDSSLIVKGVMKMMKEQGCTSVYDVAEVSLKNIDSMIKSAIDTRNDNMNIVKNIFSEETRLNDWRKLLE